MNISGTIFGTTPFYKGNPARGTGNVVDWTPSPAHFGNLVTLPKNFGNQIQWTPSSAHFGTKLPGGTVTLTLSGAGAGATTTDALGNYTLTGLAPGQYTVTPTLAGFDFLPPSRTFTISDSVNGIDFTGVQAGDGSSTQLAAPTFSPVGGAYSGAQTVTLTVDPNATATYYTTDGSTPTTASTLYTGPITTVGSGTEVIKAFSHGTGLFTDSPVAIATYAITSVFTFTPSSGTYSTTPVVTVASSQVGTIYYTEDGTTPTIASPIYGALAGSFASTPNPTPTTGGPYVVGFTFSPTRALTISQVGRKYLSGNTHNTTIRIWISSNTTTPLATATVLAASSSDSNGFKWVTLSSSVTLLPNVEYAIAIDTASGGDSWGAAYVPSLNPYFGNITAAYNLSGSGLYPSSVGIVGDMYDSPAMMFTPAIAITQSETVKVLQGINQDQAVYQAVPGSLQSYGDSITVGFGLSSPSTQNWSAQFAGLKSLSLTDMAVSSSRLCDTGQIPQAYLQYPTGTVGNLILYGANDVLNGDTATPSNIPILVAGLQAFAVWLGLPENLKVRSSGLTYAGTWTPSTVFGLAGQASATTNDTVTTTVVGSSVYVAGAVQGANVNTIGIYVDGVLQLTQDLSDPLTHSAATAWPFCYRISGLSSGSHTVQVKVLGTAGSGTVYIQWMAGNGVNLTSPLPYVGIGDTLPQTDSTFTAQISSYNAAQLSMIATLVADGLNIQQIDDFSSVMLGSTDFQAGPPANLHPNLTGATAIANFWNSTSSL